MKLIDLLVQELPKLGGWPEGAVKIHQDYDGETWGWFDHDSVERIFTLDQVATNARQFGKKETCKNMVTRDQYQSALAASQNPAWNGEGVPPAGCECEYLDNNGKWYPVTIKYSSDQLVVISGVTKILGVEQGTEIAKDIIIDKPQFRPLHTEAYKNRQVAAQALCDSCGGTGKVDESLGFGIMWFDVYDAIAAGKIPGVKLED